MPLVSVPGFTFRCQRFEFHLLKPFIPKLRLLSGSGAIGGCKGVTGTVCQLDLDVCYRGWGLIIGLGCCAPDLGCGIGGGGGGVNNPGST